MFTQSLVEAWQAGLLSGLFSGVGRGALGVFSSPCLLSLEACSLLLPDLLQRLHPQVGPGGGRRAPGLGRGSLGGWAGSARTGSVFWLLLVVLWLLLGVGGRGGLGLNGGAVFDCDGPPGHPGGLGGRGFGGGGGRSRSRKTLSLVLGFGSLLLPDLLQGFNADLLGSFTGNQYSLGFLDCDGKKRKDVSFVPDLKCSLNVNNLITGAELNLTWPNGTFCVGLKPEPLPDGLEAYRKIKDSMNKHLCGQTREHPAPHPGDRRRGGLRDASTDRF